MTLELGLCHPVAFEPAGKVTQIFFDDFNEQVMRRGRPHNKEWLYLAAKS